MNKVTIYTLEGIKEYTTSQSIQEIVEDIILCYPNYISFEIKNMDIENKVKKLGR